LQSVGLLELQKINFVICCANNYITKVILLLFLPISNSLRNLFLIVTLYLETCRATFEVTMGLGEELGPSMPYVSHYAALPHASLLNLTRQASSNNHVNDYCPDGLKAGLSMLRCMPVREKHFFLPARKREILLPNRPSWLQSGES
jgi:hypothetical protein